MFSYIALYLYFYHDLLQSDESTYAPEGKSLLINGLYLLYNFQFITILLVIIYNFLRRRNVEKLLKLLEAFDDHSEKMGWKYEINHERNYWRSIFWIILHIILLGGVSTLEMYWVLTVTPDLFDYVHLFLYCVVQNAFVMSSFQFIFGVHSVASRFEILNQNTR